MQLCVFLQQYKQTVNKHSVKQCQGCGTWLQREEVGCCGQAAVRGHGRTPAPAPAPDSWGLTKFLQTLVAQKWIGQQQIGFQQIWGGLLLVIIHAEIVFSPQLTLGNLYLPSGISGDAHFHKAYCWKAENFSLFTRNYYHFYQHFYQLQLLMYLSQPGGEFECQFQLTLVPWQRQTLRARDS